MLFRRLMGKPLTDGISDFPEIHRLLPHGNGVFIHLGQLDDIPHQGNEPLCLSVNIGGKVGDILRLGKTAQNDLRKAGNGGQGRFQLVGYVRRKFPAQVLPLILFRHVQDNQHRTDDLLLLVHRVGDQMVVAVVMVHGALVMLPGNGAFHRMPEAAAGVQLQHALPQHGIVRPQQPQGTGVVGQHVGVPIQNQKALLHVLGDGGKFLLLPAQLPDLLIDLSALGGQPIQQGGQLRVDLGFVRMLRIHLVDGPHDAPGQLGGKEQGQQHHRDHN